MTEKKKQARTPKLLPTRKTVERRGVEGVTVYEIDLPASPINYESESFCISLGKNDETSSHDERGFPGDLTDPGDDRRIWHGTMP
jgi:hypothetical protein